MFLNNLQFHFSNNKEVTQVSCVLTVIEKLADLISHRVDSAPSRLLLSTHPRLDEQVVYYIGNKTSDDYQPANIVLMCEQSTVIQILKQVK